MHLKISTMLFVLWRVQKMIYLLFLTLFTPWWLANFVEKLKSTIIDILSICYSVWQVTFLTSFLYKTFSNKILWSKFVKTHFVLQALAILSVVSGFRTASLWCFKNRKSSSSTRCRSDLSIREDEKWKGWVKVCQATLAAAGWSHCFSTTPQTFKERPPWLRGEKGRRQTKRTEGRMPFVLSAPGFQQEIRPWTSGDPLPTQRSS